LETCDEFPCLPGQRHREVLRSVVLLPVPRLGETRSRSANSRRLSPEAAWVSFTGGCLQFRHAEPGQHVLGLFVNRVDDAPEEATGEQDLVGVADQFVEVVGVPQIRVTAGCPAWLPVVGRQTRSAPRVPRMFPGAVIVGLSQPAGNRRAAGQMWWGEWDSNPRPAVMSTAV
jgi:hypothetical protein